MSSFTLFLYRYSTLLLKNCWTDFSRIELNCCRICYLEMLFEVSSDTQTFTVIIMCTFKGQKAFFLFSWNLWPKGMKELNKRQKQTLWDKKIEGISQSGNWLTAKSSTMTALRVKMITPALCLCFCSPIYESTIYLCFSFTQSTFNSIICCSPFPLALAPKAPWQPYS